MRCIHSGVVLTPGYVRAETATGRFCSRLQRAQSQGEPTFPVVCREVSFGFHAVDFLAMMGGIEGMMSRGRPCSRWDLSDVAPSLTLLLIFAVTSWSDSSLNE